MTTRKKQLALPPTELVNRYQPINQTRNYKSALTQASPSEQNLMTDPFTSH
ncbi:hypothetical protein RHMOL_Rhmol05G0158300 [Rhododendron molle]|uniref:Uncharacterized protein n=1 Tax=Rhododendron molle TaxID=49168 RepID=A0ACC0NQS4_RHOML|nr:hypothetical protein RHMOL_Rhmol05G0158300 [Rhododendron molle]